MVLKLWEIDNGKVTYLKHTNSKNENRFVKLKEPMECDKIPLSKLDGAIDLLFEFVSSIKKFDSVVIVNDGKDKDIKVDAHKKVEVEVKPDDNVKVDVHKKVDVEVKPDDNVEAKPEEKVETSPKEKVETSPKEKVETSPKEKVETWAWGNEYDKDNGKEVPKEVSDKLNLLLQEDGEKKGGAQFLINKNAKICVDVDKNSSSSNGVTDFILLPKEDVVVKEKYKKERKKRCSGYEEAVIKCSPKILKDVLDSNDAKTLVNSSDLAKMMGEEFVGIDPGLLDANVRYRFFDCGLIMTVLSHKETDIYANKGEKVFRFRLKNERDKLPDCILKQRNKVNT